MNYEQKEALYKIAERILKAKGVFMWKKTFPSVDESSAKEAAEKLQEMILTNKI